MSTDEAVGDGGLNMVGFFVDDRAHFFVGDDTSNRQFLEGVDPDYWAYQAIVHGEQLDSENQEHRQRAAVALRIVYSQAVETLLSFLGAVTQCPTFPLAWLMQYHNSELRSVVQKIHDRRGELPSPLKARPSWPAIANAVFEYVPEPKRAELTERFSRFWYRLAAEFLEEPFEREYNSLKHGMRAQIGGVTVALSPPHPPGERAQDEVMQTIGASDYGSTFWNATRKLPGYQRTYELGHYTSCGWNPRQFAAALPLIGMSVQNLVNRCLVSAGDDPSGLGFVQPADAEAFDRPWLNRPSIRHISFGNTTDAGEWEEPSAEEMRLFFERQHEKKSGEL